MHCSESWFNTFPLAPFQLPELSVKEFRISTLLFMAFN
jgi:hypothetical protein